MTSKRLVLVVLVFFVAFAGAKAWVRSEAEMAQDEIKGLIEASYINGAFNDLDTESMRKGFHPIFKIHGSAGGEIQLIPIDDWIKGIEKRKASPDYKPEKWDHRFVFVDVTESAAVAKIELFNNSKHIYTDYLSLLKFDDGWKITDKVYHQHVQS